MKVLHFILIFGLLVFLQIQLTFAGSPSPGNRPKSNRWHHDSCQSGYNEIRLYGGSKVFGATHHVLIILKSACGTYRLLEVGKDNFISSKIEINDQIGSTREEAIAKRNRKDSPTTEWGDVEYVECSYQSVQNVINEYDGTTYDLYFKNCRCFVNSLFRACGSNKRTTSGEPFASFFECNSDGKIGCCSIFDTTCCCRYSDGSVHSYHSWGRHRQCVNTKNCDLGWKC